MPRYFFTVVYPDQTEIRDPRGTPLRGDAAAIKLAGISPGTADLAATTLPSLTMQPPAPTQLMSRSRCAWR